jgi:hypothetical protein
MSKLYQKAMDTTKNLGYPASPWSDSA